LLKKLLDVNKSTSLILIWSKMVNIKKGKTVGFNVFMFANMLFFLLAYFLSTRHKNIGNGFIINGCYKWQ